MKLGIPTLVDFYGIEEHAELCKQCGCDFIELNFTFPWLDCDQIDVDRLVKAKEQNGFFYTVHLHDQLEPLSFCGELRRAGTQNVLRAIQIACELGATNLTMHLNVGAYSSRVSGKIYLCNLYMDRYLDNARRFADEVYPYLEKHSVNLCIENTTGFVSAQKRAIELMLEYPHFGLTFDVGHSYKSNANDEEFVLSHKDKIKHFHLHDVTSCTNHIALGEGLIDIPKYFQLVKETADIAVVEVKEPSALQKSMQYITSKHLI